MRGRDLLQAKKGEILINCISTNQGVLLEGRYLSSQLESLQNELLALVSKSSGELEVDLSGVVGGDSSLISVLLACMRQANKETKKILFIGFSQQLMGLLQLSNLDEIVVASR